MPNIASVLKSEIVRLARKAIRTEVESLKKSASAYRTEIASLKRRSQSLEQQLRRLGKATPKPGPASTVESGKTLRFSAKGLASQRKRLGLSAEACGLLLGTSGQSVYNWESGKARPRASHLAAIAALRSLSKSRAAELLVSRRSAEQRS